MIGPREANIFLILTVYELYVNINAMELEDFKNHIADHYVFSQWTETQTRQLNRPHCQDDDYIINIL